MKKALVILVLVILLFSICACSYVPSKRFMSRSQVNSLVNEYGTPQAVVTLSYEMKDGGVEKNFEIKLTYDLLLSQTPLAVIRFIQLANEGYYNDTLIDTYNSTYNYMIMGRYIYKDSVVSEKENDKTCYVNNALDVTFKGEFASNNYREPKDGYAQFNSFSLAMFHDEYKNEKNTNFDSANGALILALDEETLNSNNYAVFAHMVSMSYKSGDKPAVTMPNGGVHPQALANLKSFTQRINDRIVYTDTTEETKVPSFYMMKQIVTVQVEIVGNNDWSKLPRIGK